MNNKQQFEAWYLENWGCTEDNHDSLFEESPHGGEYYRFGVRLSWQAWQAASKASEHHLAAVVAENARLKNAVDIIETKYMNWERLSDAFSDARGIKTPATDAFLAEVRAQARNEGINYAASRLAAAYNHGFIGKSMSEVADVVHMILDAKTDLANDPMPAADGLSGEYAEKSLVEFAAQLRQGAGQ